MATLLKVAVCRTTQGDAEEDANHKWTRKHVNGVSKFIVDGSVAPKIGLLGR